MKANGQGSWRFFGALVSLLLLIGGTVTVMPNAPTLAGPPDPGIPQPEPFYIRLDQPLSDRVAGAATVSPSQVHVAADPGTWYDLIPTQNFDGGTFPPEDWSVDTEGSTGWGQQTAQHVSGSYSAGVVTTTAGTLNTWLFYGGGSGFSLTDVADAEVKFAYWLNTNPTGDDPVYFGWAASSDGQNFYGARISGQVSHWLTGTLDLGQYVNDDYVWLAFFLSGTSTSGTQEVYVDDVTVRGMEPFRVYLPAAMRDYSTAFTFTDDFSNTNSGWPHEVSWGGSESEQRYVRGYTNKLMADYADGQGIIDSPCRQPNRYFMRVGNPNAGAIISRAPVKAGAQFTMEVDVAYCDTAHNASTGVVFGLNDAFTQYYRVILIYDAVDHSIKYAVWRNTTILVNTSSSSHLSGGYATNRLKVVRDGCNISIYFNDHLARTLTNECSYIDERWVGLFHDRYSYYGFTGSTVYNFQLEGALRP